MRTSNRRRALAAVGAAAVVVSMGLTACSKSKPVDNYAAQRVGAMADYGVGKTFKASEPLTFGLLLANNPNYPYNKDWPFWKWLQDKTNVSFNATAVPLSDYVTKRETLITGGQAPQIMTRFYATQENEFVASGSLLPVSDYIDLLPNFKKRVQDWNMQSDLLTETQADGKYYTLPGMHEIKQPGYSFAVRQDLLDKDGIKAPTNLDQFEAMLKTLKDKECAGVAGCYPLSDLYNNSPATEPAGNLIKTIAAAYGVHAGWDYNTVSWNYDTKKYELTGESDGYKKTITYLNKLVTEGLLDPESFTQSDDQARQKLAQGKSFVISGQVQDIVNNYSKDVAAIAGAKMKLIPMLTGPWGEKIFGGRLENGIAFPASIKDSPNFVAIMQFCDWLFFSDEGQEFAKWGLQGTTYTKDSSGKRTLDPGVTMLGFNAGAPKHLQKDFGVYNGAFVYGGTADLDTSFYSQDQKDFITASLNGRTIADLPPPAPLNDDETQQVSFITQPLMDHIMTETLRFITGQRPLSDWDNFVKEQNDLKAQDYLNITDTAQQRFASSTGGK